MTNSLFPRVDVMIRLSVEEKVQQRVREQVSLNSNCNSADISEPDLAARADSEKFETRHFST